MVVRRPRLPGRCLGTVAEAPWEGPRAGRLDGPRRPCSWAGEAGRSASRSTPSDGHLALLEDAPFDLSGSAVVVWTGEEVHRLGREPWRSVRPIARELAADRRRADRDEPRQRGMVRPRAARDRILPRQEEPFGESDGGGSRLRPRDRHLEDAAAVGACSAGRVGGLGRRPPRRLGLRPAGTDVRPVTGGVVGAGDDPPALQRVLQRLGHRRRRGVRLVLRRRRAVRPRSPRVDGARRRPPGGHGVLRGVRTEDRRLAVRRARSAGRGPGPAAAGSHAHGDRRGVLRVRRVRRFRTGCIDPRPSSIPASSPRYQGEPWRARSSTSS